MTKVNIDTLFNKNYHVCMHTSSTHHLLEIEYPGTFEQTL